MTFALEPLHRTLALFFFFNDTATTEIYTLSLHDALPILTVVPARPARVPLGVGHATAALPPSSMQPCRLRSEEHTSELQSHLNLVCRLLLEKKKKKKTQFLHIQKKKKQKKKKK